MSQPSHHIPLLHVISAEGLVLVSRKQFPKAYVEIRVEGTTVRTRAAKRSSSPTWNESFPLNVQDLSSTISLRVKHESFCPLNTPVLGQVDISIEEMIQMSGSNPDIILNLYRSSHGGNSQNRGLIKLRIQMDEAHAANAQAIVQARQDLQSMHPSHIEKPAEVVQGVANAVSDQTDTLQSLEAICSKLAVFVTLVDEVAKIHPYVNFAWQITSSLYKAIQGQFNRDKKIADLVGAMELVYSFVDAVQAFPDKVVVLEDTITRILKQTIECAMFIREYTGHGFAGRVSRQTFSGYDGKIDAFSQNFMELKKSFDSGVGIQAVFVSLRIDEKLEGLIVEQALLKLKPAEMDGAARSECLPDTRLEILKSITDWITSPSSQRILWLHGFAGSGKSTISTTIANFFREQGRLGAFLFFNRNVTERSNPGSIIRTLAYQLGAFDSRIGSAMAAAIQTTPSIAESLMRLQFTKLLLEPLTSLSMLHNEGPVILILDALDECGSVEARRPVLLQLTQEFTKLPPCFRILITSRAEFDIKKAFEHCPSIFSLELRIDTVVNRSDILSYLRHNLGTIRKDDGFLPLDWPSESQLSRLVDCAKGLFVWASTVSKFISEGIKPDERLDAILHGYATSNAVSALDSLYKVALTSSGSSGLWNDEVFTSSFRDILGTIVVARDPLTHTTIDTLLYLDKPPTVPCAQIISRLGCVLHYKPGEPVRVLHPSFSDFLSDSGRCGENAVWFVDLELRNRRLAFQCLDRLEHVLESGGCKLPFRSPWVDTNLPEDISYACSYWIDHLCTITKGDVTIGDRVGVFLQQRVHHWLDALGILNRPTSSIRRQMASLRDWAEVYYPTNLHLQELISDTLQMVRGRSRNGPALFALLIGINMYESIHIRNSVGSVIDARLIRNWLHSDLRVSKDSIIILENAAATRDAILNTFREHFIYNDDILPGDAMLFYFSGHGAKVLVPGKEEEDKYAQSICPHDFHYRYPKSESMTLDDELSELLAQLAKKRGNNITVVLDCDYAGSPLNVRHNAGSLKGKSKLAKVGDISGCLQDVTLSQEENWVPTRLRLTKIQDYVNFLDSNVPINLLKRNEMDGIPDDSDYDTMASHILIAACGAEECLFETEAGGNFTGAFLECVRRHEHEPISCEALIQKVGCTFTGAGKQTPQYEGTHKNRCLFDGRALRTDRRFVPVFTLDVDTDSSQTLQSPVPTQVAVGAKIKKTRVDAGSIHGVFKGTQFSLHTSQFLSAASDLETIGTLIAEDVFSTFCYVSSRSVESKLLLQNDGCQTIISRYNYNVPFRIYFDPMSSTSPIYRGIMDPSMRSDHGTSWDKDTYITRASRPEEADLVVHFNGHQMCFDWDRWMLLESKVARIYNVRDALKATEILLQAARFNLHLHRQNENGLGSCASEVAIQVIKLDQKLERQGTIPVNEGPAGINGQLYFQEAEVWCDIKLTNNSGVDLFFHIFYFDPSDYSIITLYRPLPATELPLKDGSTVSVATARNNPLHFFVSGYLKIFFSEEYAKLDGIELGTDVDAFGPPPEGTSIKERRTSRNIWSAEALGKQGWHAMVFSITMGRVTDGVRM